MKTVAVIQARMGSSRLPGKVLMILGMMPVIEWAARAAQRALGDDGEVVIATSTESQDDAIADWCELWLFKCVRGSESDVLSRFAQVAEETQGDVFVRLTADCPFLDSSVIAQVVKLREMTGADYSSNIDPPTFPDGLDTEVFTRRALLEAHAEATRASDRDCVTRFIARNRHRYKAVNLTCPLPGLTRERWVLDTEDDYKFCQEIAQRLNGTSPSYLDILKILDKEPDLRKINAHHPRNERFYEAISTEDLPPRTYDTSTKLLKNAERLIPLGAQTFSKSKLQFPLKSPLFVTHGDGAYVYDVDGNDYVDLVSALLPNILGYRDSDIDYAVRRQLDSGASLSLSTELEATLAAMLCNYIPCAEMVRFGKTGTDVTTAAVRLARAHTKRKYIVKANFGYHGWNDWSVCNDQMRNLGVHGQLVQYFTYGDIAEVTEILSEKDCACVIVEPETNPGFLKELRSICTKTGTVLIFDEVITGWRWAMGGAQQKFGVTPDLACFGKAMGNGMPISALVGKREIMQTMEKVCFSGTFFGETLSLAASIATINKLDRCHVVEHLREMEALLYASVMALISENGIQDKIQIASGPLLRLTFSDSSIKALFMQEMAAQGVLIIASHNLTYAHKDPQVKRILMAYRHTLAVIRNAIDKDDVAKRIGEVTLAPTVREVA